MLYSQRIERSRRFKLALRIGLPLFLLVATLFVLIIRQTPIQWNLIDIAVVAVALFVMVYFIFFLINHCETESYIDPLSGAFQRETFIQTLTSLKPLSKRSLTLIRIENLSNINDHYGIEQGDHFLKIFIQLLNHFFLLKEIGEPIIGRYHGGDFLIYLPKASAEVAEVCHLFQRTYKEINSIELQMYFRSVDWLPSEKIPNIINHLYDLLQIPNNTTKRDTIAPYSDNLAHFEQSIVEAIKADQLVLMFDPFFNLQTKQYDLFETVVRLKVDDALITPKKFLPIVNRLGYDKLFDQLLLKHIVNVITTTDETIRFCFTLSSYSLKETTFLQEATSFLERYDLQGRAIVQIFEQRPCKQIKHYRQLILQWKEAGLCFALNHFGTLNASVEYIKNIPIEMIHFDKSFSYAYRDPRYEALLRGYLWTARSLGITTTMRWIDTPEQKERWEKEGIDYIQGFAIKMKRLELAKLQEQYQRSQR